MIRIFDIALKDLLQLSRDFKTFMFLLIMPVLITVLFGYAFGGFSAPGDSRIPVGYLSQDDGNRVTEALHALLVDSDVIRLQENYDSPAALEQAVAEGDIAAAVIVPQGYGRLVLKDK